MINDSVKNITSGLEGLLNMANDMVNNSMKDLDKDKAKQVADQMQSLGLVDKLKEAQSKINSLKGSFDNIK